ncbi:LytR C-terminal domain-containing protein [Georgenia subflava]|nr:LytR C-terminal domain-containing protein [Georgenia subflava]
MHNREDYPEDEFDVAGRDRIPQGVHRGARPMWRTLLPIVAIVVLAPLLAWGAISLLGGAGEEEPPPTATTAGEETDPAGEPTGGPTGEPTDGAATDEPTDDGATDGEPTDEPTDGAGGDVQLDASIVVLNGAGINGLAGEAVTELSGAGFTGGSAADYASAAPASTTLYYNNAELQATAEEVADVLGITDLVESASATQTVDIAVVLRADFAG